MCLGTGRPTAYAAATLSAATPAAVQQTVKATGRVVDQNGLPVAGASVVERGYKTNGVMTDNEGRFTLNVHSATAELTVSFIGYYCLNNGGCTLGYHNTG